MIEGTLILAEDYPILSEIGYLLVFAITFDPLQKSKAIIYKIEWF